MDDGRIKSKRVLVAHNISRGNRGGMALMMESMHAALEEFGWEIEYFTADDLNFIASPRLRRYAFSWYTRRHALRALVAGRPYDIINIHEPSGAALVFGKPRLGNPAVVAMSHGLEQRYWELCLQGGQRGPKPPSLKERITFPLMSLWQSWLTLRKADHVLCSNAVDRKFLIERLRVAPEKITLILHPAGPEFARVASRRRYDRPCTKLIFAGTWTERKGIRQLIESFPVLAKKYPALQLDILGAGLAAERVLDDFPAPLRSRICVYSSTSHEEAARILLDCDIFLLPSYFEGGPLTLVEAMYTGLPAITTSSWLTDFVRDGQNCLVIAPGSAEEIVHAVEKLMNDAGLRERIGRQGHADATGTQTWRALAQIVDKVYSNLLKS
jgi:glycosyltransferase involved in cell wall biosynthesis